MIPHEVPFLLILHQACWHDEIEQTGSLLLPFQEMEHGAKIDLTPIERITTEDNNGHQKLMISDKTILLHFDGRKMFLNIKAPTELKCPTLGRSDGLDGFPNKKNPTM